MSKLTFTAIAVFAAVLVAFASTAAASGGSDDPRGDDHGGKAGRTIAKSGTCSAASNWKLKVKSDDGRLETEFEVDQNRVGKRWRVTSQAQRRIRLPGIRTTRGAERLVLGAVASSPAAPGGSSQRRRPCGAARPAAQPSLSELCPRSRGRGSSCLRPRRSQDVLSLAQSAACVRSVTPICWKTLVRCAFTVFSLIPSRRAISLFGRPSATQPQHLALALAQLGALARRRVR